MFTWIMHGETSLWKKECLVVALYFSIIFELRHSCKTILFNITALYILPFPFLGFLGSSFIIVGVSSPETFDNCGSPVEFRTRRKQIGYDEIMFLLSIRFSSALSSYSIWKLFIIHFVAFCHKSKTSVHIKFICLTFLLFCGLLLLCNNLGES